MIEDIKNDLAAKLQYLSTINDRDLKSVCEHIITFEKGVTANPTGSLTRALSLVDTPTLEKTSTAMKTNNNADYKTSLLSKVFYASDILVLTKKECAIKTMKELGKGAFDLSVKYMIFSQFFNESDGYMSWNSLELEIEKVIKERVRSEAFAQGKASAASDTAMNV